MLLTLPGAQQSHSAVYMHIILPLPCNQSSVCSLWVCFANKFICIISFQVLHISNIILGYSSFCGFTQYDLLFMHVAANDIIPNGCVIFHYINKYTHTHTHTHTPCLLYPFLCWLIFRLLPCTGYCKQYSSELWLYVSFQIVFFSGYMPRNGTAGYGSCF